MWLRNVLCREPIPFSQSFLLALQAVQSRIKESVRPSKVGSKLTMFAVRRIYRLVVLLAVSTIAILHEQEDAVNAISEDCESTGANIFITVSSLASYSILRNKITERQIELNWFNVEDELVVDSNVWIGLFLKNPEEDVSSSVANATVASSEGYFKTDVSFPYLNFSLDNVNDTCLGFWIALIRNGRVLTSNCYSIRPNWMYEMRDVIGERTLLDLMLPGTHNAGAYMRYTPRKDNIVTKFQMCQDEDIENQLIYGNRFLDLRPAYQDTGRKKEEFWISHGIFRTNISIKSVLKAVRNFIDSTKEIVIIDFHEFNLGSANLRHRHEKLMQLIIQEVGHYALTRNHGYKKTLNELWKMNKRLLIGYGDERGSENMEFFPGVRHLWANKDNLQELKQYFDNTVCYQNRHSLWSAMAELTPDFFGIARNSYNSLREMAQNVNLNVTEWFRSNWSQCANIVSTDYFLGNGIINVAIQRNKRKWER